MNPIKYLFLTLITLFLISPSFAQKIKDKRVAIKYVSLPSEKLPDDFKTYSVRVYGSGVSTAGLNPESLANSIKMDGFKRLAGMGQDFGHLRVSAYAGYVSTGRGELKSKTTTKKDKAGNETKTTSYWYEVPFSMNYSYKVVAPDGTILASGNQNVSEKSSSGSSSSSSQARKNYSSSINSMRTSFASKTVNNMVSAARSTLVNRFDFDYARASVELYLIKKDKSEDGFEKSFETAKKVFEKVKAITPADEVKEQLKPAMKFWVEQADRDLGGDKKLKRIYKAANYNLALVNYYLNNMDAAKMYANNVIKSEGKDKKSKNLLSKIAKTEKLMALHGINTMHYKRDLSNAMGPAKVKEFEDEKEELAAANNSSAGTLTMDGKQIEGSVMQDKEAEEMIFGKDGNVKFMVESGGEMKEYDLTATEVSAFSIGDRSFSKIKFSPCAKGKEEANYHILEEVYNSDKIKLYKYYPTTGALAGAKTEFAFQKTGEEAPSSLMDTQFLILKKGLAKYFSDCADLAEMCTEGAIGMNQDDLIKAARIYSEVCE